MILYRFVDIYIQFQAYFLARRKREFLPTSPHILITKKIHTLWMWI